MFSEIKINKFKSIFQLTHVMPGAVIVQPHAPLLSGLIHYLKEDLNNSVVAPVLRKSSLLLCDQVGSFTISGKMFIRV